MAVYETKTSLACPQERVFDYLVQPANLVKLVPPSVGLAIVKAPERLDLGDKLEFKIQAFGQVLDFVHEIIAFQAPARLTEKQLTGLFGRWLQEQTLSPAPNDETEVAVRVEFEPPKGLLGFLVTKGKILEYLEDGFAYRHEQMRRLLAAP